jgi:D-alanyl-D-alanine carboxypeptidase
MFTGLAWSDAQQVRSRPVLALSLLLAATVFVTAAMAWPRTATSGSSALERPGEPAAVVTAPPSTAAVTAGAPSGLHAGLVAAFEAAVVGARRVGHRLTLTSGFRTAAQQEALLAEAIAERGAREAYRWVFPADRSMHVRGLAVDVGDKGAAAWLDGHGAAFGLCRTLDWEWWHFEWRREWQAGATCPRPVDDPADAPS